MVLDADALLDGPRGRRLVLDVARGGSSGTVPQDVRRAVLDASYLLDPGAGTSVVRMVATRDGARRDPDPPPPTTPADVVALLARAAVPRPDRSALAAALDVAVAFARYWQAPDGEDVLASAPEVRDALRPVARAVARAGGAAWWTDGIDRGDQWVVRFVTPGRPGPQPGTVDDVLDAWRGREVTGEAAAVRRADARASRKARARRHATSSRAAVPGWSPFPGAEVSGAWWSMPPADLVGSTRRWEAALAGPGAAEEPVGLTLVEDGGGWEEAVVSRLVVDLGARVLEVDGPAAWADLCRRHPFDVTASRGDDWRRATGRTGRWVAPDWASVAREVDAVHLTVAGYLTTAGRAVEVDDDTASVLAGWDPDRTWWFRGARVEPHAERWHRDPEAGWVRAA